MQPRGSNWGSGNGCCTLGSGTSCSLKPAAYSTANTSRKHLATMRAVTAGLQHVIFLSYHLGRWSVAGSPRTCQMLFISQDMAGKGAQKPPKCLGAPGSCWRRWFCDRSQEQSFGCYRRATALLFWTPLAVGLCSSGLGTSSSLSPPGQRVNKEPIDYSALL